MPEKEKFDIIDAAKKSFASVKLFFKEFKWDKAHVGVLLKFFLEALFFAFIITLDLCLKDYLYDFVQAHDGHYVAIEGVLELVYSANTGMGFGMFKGGSVLLAVITGIVIGVIILYLLFVRKDKAFIRIPLIMVAAGGIGNLVDRAALGYVRDFFMFSFWKSFPVFNVADSFITVGAIALIIGLIVMLVVESKGEWKPDAQTEGAQGETSADSSAEENKEGDVADTHKEGAVSFTVTEADGEEKDGESEKVAFTVTEQTETVSAGNDVEPADTEIPAETPAESAEGNAEENAPTDKKPARKSGKRAADAKK